MIGQRMPDGTIRPVQPLGWREEHNRLQRLVLWLLRRPHCNDREARR